MQHVVRLFLEAVYVMLSSQSFVTSFDINVRKVCEVCVCEVCEVCTSHRRRCNEVLYQTSLEKCGKFLFCLVKFMFSGGMIIATWALVKTKT
mgnify:CR=1 FL=1